MLKDQYQIRNQNGIHFLSLTVVKGIDLFTLKENSFVIVDSLNYCSNHKNLEIFAWIILSNHVHLVCKVNAPHKLSDFLRDFKKFTSKKLIKTIMNSNESRSVWMLDKFGFEAKRTRRAKYFKVWNDGNQEIELYDKEGLKDKIDDIHNKAVREMIVNKPEDYVLSSAMNYHGFDGLVKITICKF
ncbi:MAG: transposase [Flavobacteriales bacterium]|nr:transposase [Flavobacteriales bacterium]